MAARTGKNETHSTAETNQETQSKEPLPVELEVRIHSIKPGEAIKGSASVNINNAFAIRGIKIIEGTNGLFVSMPSYKSGNDYKDICFPLTAECRKQLNDAVLEAYEQALSQGQNGVMKHHEKQQTPEGQEVAVPEM